MSSETMFPVFGEFGLRIEEMFPRHAKLDCGSEVATGQAIDLHYGNVFASLILGNVILPSAVLVRMDAYHAVNGFRPEFRNAEDTEFFLRLAKEFSFLYIDEPLLTYRRGSESLLATSMLKTIIGGIRSVEINCRDDSATYRRLGDIVDRSLARKYARLGYFYLTELDSKSAFSAARTALQYKKGDPIAWKVMLASLLPEFILARVRALNGRRKAMRVNARRAETSGESRRATANGSVSDKTS
jgi:hypothetical protein